jgi:hypothetical protein
VTFVVESTRVETTISVNDRMRVDRSSNRYLSPKGKISDQKGILLLLGKRVRTAALGFSGGLGLSER